MGLTDGSSSDMSTAQRSPPEALRAALRRDPGPVRPLLPPAARTIIVLAIALGAGGLLIFLAGVRPDRAALDPRLFWTPAVVRILAGALLILLAMREGVPGSGSAAIVKYTSLLGAPVLLTLLTDWVASTARGSMETAGYLTQLQGALGCYPSEVLVAIPAILFIAWLLARAYSLRPVFAAMAGATGAGLIADAVLHLTCPMTAMFHTLLIHGSAVASLAAIAAGIGWLAGRRRLG